MGHLMSKNKNVSRLEFSKIRKNTLYKGVDVIEIDHGCIIKLKDGSIVGSGYRHDAAYMDEVIGITLGKALIKMGCLTQEDIDAHNNYVKSIREKDDLKWEAQRLKKILEKNNLNPSKEQQQFLDENDKPRSLF